MGTCPPVAGWRRFLVTRVRTRTSWPFRVAFAGCLVLAAWLTSDWWTVVVARDLICHASGERSDALVVENFDPHYLLFERAEHLRRAGVAPRVLLPVTVSGDSAEPNPITRGTAELMARVASLQGMEFVPFRQIEPISLNAARDIRRFLDREKVRSVTVVTPIFRSRRSISVYTSVFRASGIVVRCDPVGDPDATQTWTRSWHGIQNVVEQWAKLQYYRFLVLPRFRFE